MVSSHALYKVGLSSAKTIYLIIVFNEKEYPSDGAILNTCGDY